MADYVFLEEHGAAEAQLIVERLRAASAVFAQAGPPHGDIAQLLVDAAAAVEHLAAEVRVQRGMAIASQAVVESLSQRLDSLLQVRSGTAAAPLRLPPQPQSARGLAIEVAAGHDATGGHRPGQRRAQSLLDDPYAMPYGADVEPPPRVPARTGTVSPPHTAGHDGSPAFRALGHGGSGAAAAAGGGELGVSAPQGGRPVEDAGGNDSRADADFESQAPAFGGGGGGSPGASSGEATIDALVASLKRRFRQSGVPLPLSKQQGTVYRLGSKRINLDVREGRLVVRSPGGQVTDVLEYLTKSDVQRRH